jgi:predicted Zn-dependent peptidase
MASPRNRLAGPQSLAIASDDCTRSGRKDFLVPQTIHSHTFDNGLVLLAEPLAWLESAAFTLLIPAGCSLEPADRGGLAALACEMALRGCGPRDSRAFVDALDALGLERGESVNAAHASFGGATLARNLMPALSIYADLVRRPHLADEQLEAARATTLQELESVEDDPSHKVMIELRRRHYPDPWGRPSTGERSGIESSTIEDVRSFVSRNFQPQGAILAVAGRVEWAPLVDLVGSLFGDWKPAPPAATKETAAGAKQAHLSHESNQTQIGVAYPSVAYRDPQYFQAWGAVGALSGGMSCRLFTEVRERRGLCYSVYATHHTLRDRGSVLCYAGTSAERAQETLDVLVAELVRLARGIEPFELERLKARVKSGLIMQQESSSARSGAIARDWYLLGRVRPLDELGALVDALTCESINVYLAAHPPRDFTIVTLGSQPLEVPVAVSAA